MKCPACGNERLMDDAHFCPQCGTKLNPVVAPVAETKPAPNVEFKQDVEHVTGGEVAGVKMGDVHGDFVLHMTVGSLAGAAGISTEVTPHASAGTVPAVSAQQLQVWKNEIGRALDLLEAANQQGKPATEVQAGDILLSKVALLVKQAVLLKTEAEQMMMDFVAKQKPLNSGTAPGHAPVTLDLNRLMAGFDHAAYEARLNEAKGLLEEANRLDPTNTEVLLHMAQLLGQLTPEDPSDERRLLYRISQLLDPPKNAIEQFQLAQTVFMLAMTSRPIDLGNLQNARDMFEKLGRTDWVRYCENIASMPSNRGTMLGGGAQLAAFQPVGRWHIQINDMMRSQMWLDCYPNGAFQSSQQGFGFAVQAAGRWGFNPYNQMLQLQGFINGIQPFVLGIAIQGPQGNGYIAVGTDGLQYILTRAS